MTSSEPAVRLPTSRLRTLRGLALGLVVLVVLQAALGSLVASELDAVKPVHAVIGYTVVLVSAVTAVVAYLHARAGGRMGTFWHALSLPVLSVVQIGLAEMELEAVRIGVGVLVLVAVIGLYAMVRKA